MFEERTGCKVSYLRMPTGEAVAKMTAEKDNPSVNVYLGGTVDGHENLVQQGLLVPYKSSTEAEMGEGIRRQRTRDADDSGRAYKPCL